MWGQQRGRQNQQKGRPSIVMQTSANTNVAAQISRKDIIRESPLAEFSQIIKQEQPEMSKNIKRYQTGNEILKNTLLKHTIKYNSFRNEF